MADWKRHCARLYHVPEWHGFECGRRRFSSVINVRCDLSRKVESLDISKCFNSFLYADDLILISISVCDLQLMLDKCLNIFDSLDLQINVSKSNCLRIGPNFRACCKPIVANGSSLQWVNEARYLGVVLKNVRHFSCEWRTSRCSFFKSINSILGSLGSNPSPEIILALFHSKCIPILTYGTSSVSLTKSDMQRFSFCYNSVFAKLF